MTIQEVEHIQKGDAGTVLFLVVLDENGSPVNLATATVLKIYIKQPVSLEVDEHVASVYDAPNGIMSYTLTATDDDEAGLCAVQGYVESPTWTGRTSIEYYYVEDNLA